MLRPYCFIVPEMLRHPVSRRRRYLHLRHHPIGKSRARRKLRKLDQLEYDFALALRFDAAQRAISEVHGPGGGKQPLRPELDFIGGEMHGDVSHWVSYGPVIGPVSVSAICEPSSDSVSMLLRRR